MRCCLRHCLRIALGKQKIHKLAFDDRPFHLQPVFNLLRIGIDVPGQAEKGVASSGSICAALCAQYQNRAAFSLAKIKVC